MRKCRLCGSLIRRKALHCRFCTAPQTDARGAQANGASLGPTESRAPHWLPAGASIEPEWTPEPVEPRDAIVVDDFEAQLLASDFRRATERRTDRTDTIAPLSLDDTPPNPGPVRPPDPPPPPPTMPETPIVKLIASGTASDESADAATAAGPHHRNGHANGNGHADGNGSNGDSHGNANGNGNGHVPANGNGNGNGDADEHLVGFAHFPDATAAPKVRWG
jgi:hypothetical protein